MGYQSLVTVIERVNPDTLERLRQQHGPNSSLFTTARDLGPAQEPNPPNPDRVKALLDLANTGTSALRARLDQLLQIVLTKMRLASRVKLVGALAATISGGLIAVFSYSETQSKLTTLITALFGMFGGAVGVFADQAVRTPSGIAIASPEEHAKIVALRMDLERLALRLARAAPMPLSDQELEQILTKLDDEAVMLIRYEGA